MEAKFKINDVVKSVVVPYNGWGNLIVVKATQCLKGWRYTLALPKKDGTPHKRRERISQWENEIKSTIVEYSPSTQMTDRERRARGGFFK